MTMKDKVRRTIAQFHMLQQGDLVAAGVSGGADSVALLSLLCALRPELGLRLVACHVNHGLRGEESDRDEAFVRQLCGRLGVECRVLRIDAAALAKASGRSVEEAARDARYAFFAQAAGERGKTATAHTASDNAETVLLNLCRGTGLRGLCGIPPVRGSIVRPLIACTRAETEAWCRSQGLGWVEDSTNAADEYARNRLRHHVLPTLRGQNPAFDRSVEAMTRRLRRDADYLDQQARQAAEGLALPGGGLDRQGFLRLPRPLADRILLELIGGCTQPGARLEELCLALAQAGSGCQQLTAQRRFYATAEAIGVEPAAPDAPAPVPEMRVPPLRSGTRWERNLGGRDVKLSILPTDAPNSENIYNYPLKNVLCYDKIQRTLVMRTRRAGDRMALPRRGLSKPLKKLFWEEKVPPQQRDSRLVLADEDGTVLWVEGIGPAAGAAPGQDSRLLLALELSNH